MSEQQSPTFCFDSSPLHPSPPPPLLSAFHAASSLRSRTPSASAQHNQRRRANQLMCSRALASMLREAASLASPCPHAPPSPSSPCMKFYAFLLLFPLSPSRCCSSLQLHRRNRLLSSGACSPLCTASSDSNPASASGVAAASCRSIASDRGACQLADVRWSRLGSGGWGLTDGGCMLRRELHQRLWLRLHAPLLSACRTLPLPLPCFVA